MSDDGLFIIFFAGTLLAAVFAWMCGSGYERASIREQAIAAGVGTYTVDPKTGGTSFEWVKP